MIALFRVRVERWKEARRDTQALRRHEKFRRALAGRTTC